MAYFESRRIDSFPGAEEVVRAAAASRQLKLPEGIAFDDLKIPAERIR
jgi:hypothetical protein